jgi:hypothetical protein
MGNKSLDYFQILVSFLKDYQEYVKNDTDRHSIIVDEDSQNCLLIRVGWEYPHNLYAVLFHFEVIQGKVWIHRNATEELIGDELVKRGIPPQSLVLAFQPEHRRPYTGFAIA